MDRFCRTEMLIGKEKLDKLNKSRVAVFGLGGVGSYVVEALARGGVGSLTLVDDDVISESNINRQLYALYSTIGQAKVEVAKRRVADINPDCRVSALQCRFDANTANQIDFTQFDYVVDAIDTVTSKLLIAQICVNANVPVISCMGTGNKFDAAAFKIADIFETSVCPLAKVMRKELRARGVDRLKVAYSNEPPVTPSALEKTAKRQTPGSMSFVPPVAGMMIAGEVIKDLIDL
ncbi:MAG: tRNA threonylcarbamoyladenosine dehydratase [Corallococcus sp.]|nr:tRNA threonylcarbamoyladenosine dehydratase [Corallococcus sp.]